MVSEESRLFMMKNYSKMQKKREVKIKKEIIEQFEKKIDPIIYDLQRFMDTDCHAEMCHDCKVHINFIERNLSKLKEELKNA